MKKPNSQRILRLTNLTQGQKSGLWPEISLIHLLWLEDKWFDIQGFTNFTAAHFVAKFHDVNSLQNPITATCTWTVFFQSFPEIHNHRWRSEQKLISKLTALRCLKAPVLWPQSDKAHAELRLLHQSLINFHVQSLVSTTPRYLNFLPMESIQDQNRLLGNYEHTNSTLRRHYGFKSGVEEFPPISHLHSVRTTTLSRRDASSIRGISFGILDQFVLFPVSDVPVSNHQLLARLSFTREFEVTHRKRTGVWPHSPPQMRRRRTVGPPISGVTNGGKRANPPWQTRCRNRDPLCWYFGLSILLVFSTWFYF